MTPQAEAEEDEPKVTATFDELATMVRHGKYKQLKKALGALPDRLFDTSAIRIQYAEAQGTLYSDATERNVFHMNKGDDKGNSLLSLAAQNNSARVAELLVKKGANVNHQNVSRIVMRMMSDH